MAVRYTSVELENLIQEAASGEKFPLAKLITELEKPDSFEFRKILFQKLEEQGFTEKKALTIGLTGTPGAGKSSLLGEFSTEFLKAFPEKKMAIVAIDPSSHISGGSLLGDRTRLSLPPREKRLYFRSQPSQLELGGVNPYTYHVIRLLRCFFDFVFVETVGIGQNEIEVSKLADVSFLVLVPLGGDQIQFMKSGIMEVPNAFILNKCDEESLAMASYHTLTNTLEFLRDLTPGGAIPPVFMTSVKTKRGIQELLQYIVSRTPGSKRDLETATQVRKWIKTEFGNFGLQVLSNIRFPANLSFEQCEALALAEVRKKLKD
ncbi:putative LAO/AO transport system ATPase [Leptospira inadai serovar Lyme str. 10]|uniref:Protein kinase n=2 Tax=Leptospira inadai serovar Lyme TaxID=293084 RepID=A0ABX4YP30_9LEPT|nr:putative LAO/AO transport system ATPase [Leptospira inadai serovar Lyme str. 10]PNV76727.1 protein kinase [Leptospira inadai serovar Lyme]